MAWTFPDYRLPQEKPVGSAPYMQVRVPDDAFGGGLSAQHLIQGGRGFGQAADDVTRIILAEAKTANDTKVDATTNEYTEFRQKTAIDFSKLQGQAAIDAAEATNKSLLDKKKELMEKATNDYQKRELAKALDRQIIEATGHINAHVARQSELNRQETNKATRANTLNDVSLNADDLGMVNKLIEKNVGDVIKHLAQRGYGPDTEIFKSEVAAARSEAARVAIETQLAGNNPGRAVQYYDRLQDKLTAGDRKALEGSVKTARDRLDAQSEVAEAGVNVSERRAQVLDHLKKKSGDEALAIAITANYDRETGGSWRTSARNRRDGRDGSDSIGLSQVNAERAVAFEKYLKDTGQSMSDPLAHANYTLAEYNGGYDGPDGKRVPLNAISPAQRKQIDDAKTPAEKAAVMARVFWRPLDAEGAATDSATRAERIERESKAGGPPARPPTAPPKYGDPAQEKIDAEEYLARETAGNKVRNARDPQKQSDVQAEINKQYNEKLRGAQLGADKIAQAQEQWLKQPGKNGGLQTDRPPADLWNAMTQAQKESMDRTLHNNTVGQKPVHQPEVFDKWLRAFGSSDAKTRKDALDADIASIDKDKLSEEKLAELQKMQKAARDGQTNAVVNTTKTEDIIKGTIVTKLKIPHPEKSAEAQKFRAEVEVELQKAREEKGRTLTDTEERTIIEGLARHVGEGSLWGSTPRAYSLTIKDVPPAWVAKIRDTLGKQGTPATDAAIVGAYRNVLKNRAKVDKNGDYIVPAP